MPCGFRFDVVFFVAELRLLPFQSRRLEIGRSFRHDYFPDASCIMAHASTVDRFPNVLVEPQYLRRQSK